jgi:hypothetical protein
MKVYLNDTIFIKSDTMQFILVEEKTVQEGKTKGKVEENVIGFYATLDDALQSFVKQMQLESNAETIKELIQETKALKKYLKELLGGT